MRTHQARKLGYPKEAENMFLSKERKNEKIKT